MGIENRESRRVSCMRACVQRQVEIIMRMYTLTTVRLGEKVREIHAEENARNEVYERVRSGVCKELNQNV